MTKEKKEKGSFLKGLFWNDGGEEDTFHEEQSKQESEVQKETIAPMQTISLNTSTSSDIAESTMPNTTTPNSGILDSEMLSYFEDVLSQNNINGVDYFEFRASIIGMKNMTSPDKDKYIMAFTALSSLGLTKERLLETLNYYLEVLSKESESFNKSSEAQIIKKVKTKEDKIIALNKENDEISKRIEELQKKQLENGNTIAELKGEIATESAKIQQTNNNFNVTINHIIEEITNDKKHIELYIN